MAKTKEELNTIKEEVETLNKKLADLTEDGLKEVTGGVRRHNIYYNLDDESSRLGTTVSCSSVFPVD